MSASPSAAPVLLCFDGSEGSRHAIAEAAALGIGGKAIVCHAWAGLSHAVFHGNLGVAPAPLEKAIDELDELDRRAAERLAAEGAGIAEDAGFDATPAAVKEETKAWRALLAAAYERRARLIVLGAHGRSGVGRLLLGSVSNAVVTHAHTPVLVVPETSSAQSAGPLLVCWDGSAGSIRAVEVAGELFPGRRALVLNLWESWVARGSVIAGAVPPVGAMNLELDEIAQQQSESAAAAGVAAALDAGLAAEPLSSRVFGGPLWKAAVDTAGETGASAVVLGSRGLTGIAKVLGSVSHGVVNHSGVAVLVVPPELER
jgi:nucleotide-binding universal stress UspA family protein